LTPVNAEAINPINLICPAHQNSPFADRRKA